MFRINLSILIYHFLLFSTPSNSRSQVVDFLGLSGQVIRSISVSDPYIFVATDTSGIFKKDLTANDTNWIFLGLKEEQPGTIYAHPVSDSQYAIIAGDYDPWNGTDSIFVYKYLGNEEWIQSDNGIESEGGVYSVHGFPDSIRGGLKFSGTVSGLFKSTNGDYWDLVECYGCKEIIRANQKHDIVWIGNTSDTFGMWVSRTTDGGSTWKQWEIPSTSQSGVWAVATNSNDAASCLISGPRQVTMTADTGNSWIDILTLDVLFSGVAIDPGDRNHFWAGGWISGVENSSRLYESIDGGLSCKEVDLFRNYANIWKMETGNVSGIVYLGTTNGVYRYTNLTTAINDLHPTRPDAFRLYQNYPNPFNSVTRIKYDVPIATFVYLRVYNVYGQAVINVVNEYSQPGQYIVSINMDGLPSNVYFVILQTDNILEFAKIVLCR